METVEVSKDESTVAAATLQLQSLLDSDNSPVHQSFPLILCLQNDHKSRKENGAAYITNKNQDSISILQ